jgi:16S rRNA (guanine527-N7)-methyltransferase
VGRDFRSRLARRAAKAGLFLPDDLAVALTAYYELLSRWNQKINLTSLTDPDEAVDRLLLEPVLSARSVETADVRTLLDIGSGGGSPAIPLTLALGPDVALTMVEVKVRKSAFLREAIRHLGLRDAVVENCRYEELLTHPELLERCDLLSIRAVRVEPRVLMTLQAFLRPGGQMLLFRGPVGPDAPANILHPLEFHRTVPLLESLQSRLTILKKRSMGAGVPRGTLDGV